MRLRAARHVLVLLLSAAVVGCGAGQGTDTAPEASLDRDGDVSGAEVIRDWTTALAGDDYEAAADLFAPGAVVQQAGTTRLETRADAISFNQSLPCRAELTDLEPMGEATVAAFVLMEGPRGRCGAGIGDGARVRFVVRDGLIREWRQLPDEPPEPGSSA